MIKFPRLPGIFAPKKRKLRVGVARGAGVSDSSVEDISEPNMKLSRALLVVLLLHVVAVAGIIAFNAIKSRQSTGSVVAVPSNQAPIPRPSPTSSLREEEARIAPSPAPKLEKKAKAAEPTSLPQGARYYTVVKGDNPVIIAKKFKVPYDDLMAANHIDDPRKLHVGQKLIIPPKKSRKS